MEDVEMFGDSESESDSETRDQDFLPLDYFVEEMDVDIEPSCAEVSIDKNGKQVSKRKSLDGIKNISGASDESGVHFESPIQTRESTASVTTRNASGASDESAVHFESPIPRRALAASVTPGNTNSFNNDNNSYDEGSDGSGNERSSIVHSTPRTSTTRPGTTKLKIPLSIFKIDLEKVDEAIDREDRTKTGTTRNNKVRIDFMIKAAIPKRKKKRGHGSLKSEAYVSKPYKGYVNAKFELLYYDKVTYSTDEETKHENKKVHKIRFLHRTDSDAEEIFALPSGSGRNAVLQWADTNFPLSIASATLDPQSVTEKEVKNLYENRYLTRCKMKAGESLRTTPEFHRRFAPQLYTKYHAKINGDNGELKNMLGHYKDSIKMQVQLESITFPSAVIDINEYSELCEKLSEIYNNPNLPRSREFDGYLSKVSKIRKTELDNLFLKELDKFFLSSKTPQCDNVLGKLESFTFTQKDSSRYFESTDFLFYYKNKLVKRYDKPPQLHELHTVVNKKLSGNSFLKDSSSFQISILSSQDAREIKENFFNCLEGIWFDKDTQTNYWRVGYDWFQVTGRYSFDIYAQYIRILKTSLLEKRDSSLRFLWPLKENRKDPEDPSNKQTNEKSHKLTLKEYRQSRFVNEGVYNNLYAKEPNFAVADGIIAPRGVEVCDLFQYVINADRKPSIYLYHVKKAFGSNGYRCVNSQIISSVGYLYDSFTNKGSPDSAAIKLFNFVKDKQKDFTDFCKDYDEFLEQLRNATVVLAPLFESGDRDLDKDYVARLRYDFSDFEDSIDSEFREDLKEELEWFLLDSGYIYSDKDFTQKWYDACAVPKDRGFDILNDRGRHVDTFPSRPNLSSKQLRRILKQQYYTTVDGLATKMIIVNLAETLNFLGFGFKICQIEGAEDEFLIH